jgi:hypothetical protein
MEAGTYAASSDEVLSDEEGYGCPCLHGIRRYGSSGAKIVIFLHEQSKIN